MAKSACGFEMNGMLAVVLNLQGGVECVCGAVNTFGVCSMRCEAWGGLAMFASHATPQLFTGERCFM